MADKSRFDVFKKAADLSKADPVWLAAGALVLLALALVFIIYVARQIPAS